MAKRQSKIKQIKALQKAAKLSPQERLARFVEKAQYLAAIDLVKQAAQSQPDLQLTPSEGELWLKQGQMELGRSQPKLAEPHFTQALELANSQDNWLGDAYYFLAKSLLLQDRSAEALALIQSAFDQEKLPKTHGGCYLKLLLIEGETERAKALMEQQPKRFYAPQLHWLRGVFGLAGGARR
ncbi:MAG: hypothetical protein HC824_19110 [Synechococcales cyanobacterium RM1_1_8]|nr:hypothetical protein [Synechococcales cyanobacterium RM1_1_8]